MSLLLPRRRLYTNVAALGKSSGGGGGNTAEATAFLSRAVSADAALPSGDQTAYATFINGLVNTASTSSGSGRNALFDRFDVLNIFAAHSTAVAFLNLVSSSYDASPSTPAPTFVAYQGFAGDGTSSLANSFNATSSPSPNYTQNSAHLSCWNLTSAVEAQKLASTASAYIYPEFSGGDFYGRVNETTSGSLVISGSVGHLLANRSAASGAGCGQGYKNGSLLGTNSVASSALTSFNDSPYMQGSTRQNAVYSSGNSLSATDVSNFYTLLHTLLHTLNATAFP